MYAITLFNSPAYIHLLMKGAPNPRPKYSVILMASPTLFVVLKGKFYAVPSAESQGTTVQTVHYLSI